MLLGGPGGAEKTLSISCIGELPLAEMLQPEVQLQPAELRRAPWESSAHGHQPDVRSGLARPRASCLAGWCGCSEAVQKWW